MKIIKIINANGNAKAVAIHYTGFFVPFSKHLLASFVEIFGGFKPLVLFIPRSRELLSS